MRKVFLCKATALQFLGFYKQAYLNYEIALRMMEPDDGDLRDICEDMIRELKDKVRDLEVIIPKLSGTP